MIHTGVIQIQPQAENGNENEEVFGDDRRCAVLDIKKLSEHCRFTHRDGR
jgi:hypothetical protein